MIRASDGERAGRQETVLFGWVQAMKPATRYWVRVVVTLFFHIIKSTRLLVVSNVARALLRFLRSHICFDSLSASAR